MLSWEFNYIGKSGGGNYVHTGHDNSVVNHQIKLINPYPFCLKLPRETEVCQIGTSVGMCTINSFVPFLLQEYCSGIHENLQYYLL